MAVANLDITSANCKLVMTVEELFPSGIDLQMFSTDQSFSQGDSQVAETRMGVDGKMVAGYTPNIKVVTVSLEASSPSYASLAQVYKASEANKKIYPVTLTAKSPALKLTWKWSTGVLYSGTIIPPAQKIFGPTTWVFHFQDLETSRG
jgi:hypothetical protein